MAGNCFAQNTRSNLWNKFSLVIWGISISLIYILTPDYGMKMQNHGQSFTLVLWLIKDKIPHMCTKITVSKHMKTIFGNAVVLWRLFNSGVGHSLSWSSHNVQWKHFLVRNTFNIFFKSVNLIWNNINLNIQLVQCYICRIFSSNKTK